MSIFKKAKKIDTGMILMSICTILTFAGIYLFFHMFGKVTELAQKDTLGFQDCSYVFQTDQGPLDSIDIMLNQDSYKRIENICNTTFPEGKKVEFREYIESEKGAGEVSELGVFNNEFILPQNLVLEKSDIEVEFIVEKPDVTEDVTFFGFSLGTHYNVDNTMRLGSQKHHAILKKFTLDEIVFDNELKLKVANLKGNTMAINYKVNYFIKEKIEN